MWPFRTQARKEAGGASAAPVRRELAAILLCDMVGYSTRMNADEVATLRQMDALRRTVFTPLVRDYGGLILKSLGDGFLIKFGSIVEAVACGIALQKALADHGRGSAQPARFRMGINLGDIIVQDGDVFGDGVNIAARLEPLAEPGGLCLSHGAFAEVKGKISAAFVDGGLRELKGQSHPLQIHTLPPQAVEAATPPPPAHAARARLRDRRFLSVAAVVLVAAIGGGAYGWWRTSVTHQPLYAQLDALLAKALPATPARARDRLIREYLDLTRHRAFALAPREKSRWWTGNWASRETADEKVLERCQIAFNEPCMLVAENDAMLAPDAGGAWPVHDMPRTHYAGTFDIASIPGLRPLSARRKDVLGYADAPSPKAMAYHPQGLIHVVTGARSQKQADQQALRNCNRDPDRKELNGPCYLYARNNQVVLPQRFTAAPDAP